MPPTRKIAIEFDGSLKDARALARAVHATWAASRVGDGFVAVDGFQMNPADGWTGNAKITIEDQP